MPKPCRRSFVNYFSQLSCTEVPTTNKNLDRILFKKRLFKCWYVLVLVCSRRKRGVQRLIRLSGIL
jgi:hypothetical protein